MMKFSGFEPYLDLRTQRYKYRHCHCLFTLGTSLVESNCYLSIPVKQVIFLKARHKQSESDNRIILPSYEEQPLYLTSLPKVLWFDEFKSAEGAMSFLFCDASNGKVIDIVEDRLSTLKPYFMRFSRIARKGVTHVVINRYAPYMTLIKKVFSNAKIILDTFHIVQLLSRALNSNMTGTSY